MIRSKPKFNLTILLLVILTVTCLVGLTGCGDKVEQIYITNGHSPRLNYVVGQDLDLSGGTLTVVIDGEETLIPLTGEGVSVTGYNQNTIGEQTLTVTYGEKTTSFTVKVIASAVAEGYEKGYFVGDSFKADKGKIRIARDDASTFMVNMSDPNVSLESFDSSTAGDKTVTVKYREGTSEYTCTFTVTVYDPSTVTFVKPKKTAYSSHDTALDFSGGYLTVKAENNNALVKYVDITKDMVTGHDFSAATIENRTTPVTQRLTVSYLGHSFQYDITVTYSGVSVIRDMMQTLNEVDLDGETITLTDTERSAALEAISEYYRLSDAHKAHITEDDLHRIVRCAAVGVSELYREAFEEYSNTIIITDSAIQLPAKTHEDTKADAAKLADDSEEANVYAELLRSMETDFAELTLMGETTVRDYITIISEDVQKTIVMMLEHIVYLHEVLAEVPDDWTVDSLDDYSDDILLATQRIIREDFYENGNSLIYNILSNWRANNDYFEILYSYFMYVDEDYGGAEYVEDSMLAAVPWPKTMREWFSLYSNAMNISASMYEQQTKLYLTDVTSFMYYYDLLLEKTADIKNNTEDALSTDIYALIGADQALPAVRSAYCGLYYHCGILLESENFADLWDKYLTLFKLYASGDLADEDGKLDFDTYSTEFEDVMAALTKLSPTELHGFLSSLNFLYSQSRGNVLVLSKYEGGSTEGYLNAFAFLLNTYYNDVLGEDLYPMFEKLMVAMENCALSGIKETALTDFEDAMSTLINSYTALTEGSDAKTAFDTYLGDAYTKYLAIYNAITSDEDITLENDISVLFNKLEATIDKIIEIYTYIGTFVPDEDAEEETEKMMEGTYILLFALYEQARGYYDDIVTAGATNNDILLALYTKTYTVNEQELSLAHGFYYAGTVFWSYVTGLRITITSGDVTNSYSAYDIYQDADLLRSYLAIAADFLYAKYKQDYSALTLEYVNAVASAFHSLDRTAVSLCRVFGGSALHFDALSAYYKNALADDEKTLLLAEKLVDVAKAYLEYALSNQDSEKLDAFTALMAEAKHLRDDLSDTENFDAYLSDLYEDYYSFYEGLTNEETE